MFRFVRNIAVVACACVLSACYTSSNPLVTPENATYLFGSEMQFLSGDTPSQLRRDGNDYLKTEGDGTPTRIRFYRIGTGNFYVVQEQENDTGLLGSWNYDLMEVVSGDTMLLHNLRCDATLDEAFFRSGTLHAEVNESDPSGGIKCRVDSLEALVQVLGSRRETTEPAVLRILSIAP